MLDSSIWRRHESRPWLLAGESHAAGSTRRSGDPDEGRAGFKWATVLVVETLATLFGISPIQRAYGKMKKALERVFGGLMILFGGRPLVGQPCRRVAQLFRGE